MLTRHGIEGAGLVGLACVIALGPPVALWGVTRLASVASGRLDRALHLLIVGGLTGLFTIQVAKAAGLDGAVVLIVLAVAAGAGFAVAYARSAVVATWASYTAVLPVLAVGSFVLLSPSSALLRSETPPERVTGPGDVPSVVLIVLDELPTRSLLDPDDQIDPARFPNLAAFAGEATWYRHHTTLATLTEAAVPSMLTGRLPTTDQALWTNHPDNLFALLAPTHELEVLEQATELCPYDVCVPTAAGGGEVTATEDEVEIDVGGPGFGDLLGVTTDLWLERVSLGDDEPEALDDFDEEVTPDSPPEDPPPDETSPSVTVRPDRPDGDPAQALTSARADGLIRSFDADKGPALYYLHLILPHQPWRRYPDGTEYGVLDPKGLDLPLPDQKELFSWSPWTSAVSEQRHLLQAQYTDRLVGQLLDGVRDAGLYDDSLVIVTSDHGVSFESHTAGRYVEQSTIDAIAYSPLLIKEPGQRAGRVDDSNVTVMDLLPTIADRLGISIPWSIDGAAIGSPAIDARGTAKQIYDMIGYGGVQTRGILEFDDEETFATVRDRWIGPLSDPRDPLSALLARLGLDDLIGSPLDDLVTDEGGEITIDALDALRHPTADEPRIGFATGMALDAAEDATVLLAIDGVVVTGSLLSTDADGRSGHLSWLLPQGSLDDENDIRAAVVTDGEVVEVEVRPG